MNLEKAVKKWLNHYKILKAKLEASQTKSALIIKKPIYTRSKTNELSN